MRIVQIISGTALDGAARYCFLVTRGLAERGHEVTLAHRPGAWIGQATAGLGIRRVETSMRRSFAELRRFGAILREIRPEVMHTHMSSANSYGMIFRFAGIRRVATAHACFFQPHWLANDRVIAPNDRVAAYMHRYNRVPRSRIRTIPNFIDTEAFAPVRPDRRRKARERMRIADDAAVFASIGAVSEGKGSEDLVEAFVSVRRRFPNAHLVLIGVSLDSPAAGAVRAIAEREGLGEHLHLLGFQANVAELLQGVDVLVCASKSETGPLAVLEAMATGLPVVSTDVGAVRRFIAEGESGHIVGVGDVPSLADRMIRLAGNPEGRGRFGSMGRRRVVDEFSVERAIPQIEAVLAEAAR
jgi:glycosyltransferase involved in cell wall biosynthesis